MSPRVFFAPAYASAKTESRPEFENSGWVWPNLNVPHSERSKVPQPLTLTLSRSDQPSAF